MKELLKKYKMIINYSFHSVLSTILDTTIGWAMFGKMHFPLLVSNTVGVVAGFILGFFLDVRNTFKVSYSKASFAVYIGTFLIGLVLANILITQANAVTEPILGQGLGFLVSKGISVILPFFAMYFIRKYAFGAIQKREETR